MTSLFALAISELFIVNVWANNLGNNAASSLAVLKDIFELNIKLKAFKKDAPKKFLFIIRDFDDVGNKEKMFKTKELL